MFAMGVVGPVQHCFLPLLLIFSLLVCVPQYRLAHPILNIHTKHHYNILDYSENESIMYYVRMGGIH